MSAIQFRPLSSDDVEVRIGQCSEKGCSLLLYKTSRTDMALLDETVGPENWQCDYRSIDGKLFCGIGCRFQDGEWVWKWDTGTPSNMEAQKGEASDAMKRAGFKWGIGRELYTAPFIWVGADCLTRHSKNKNGRWQCYDDFRVTDMAVDGGQIVKLTICNMSNRGMVVYGTAEKPKVTPLDEAKSRMWNAIKGYAQRHDRDPKDILKGVQKRPEWEEQHESVDWLTAVAIEFETND